MRNEAILDPTNGKTLTCPPGTTDDLVFLKRMGIDPWSALGMVTYVNGEHPWTEDGGVMECDRDRHLWTGPEVKDKDGRVSRTCDKCGAIEGF
jgi:hypothetical protein